MMEGTKDKDQKSLSTHKDMLMKSPVSGLSHHMHGHPVATRTFSPGPPLPETELMEAKSRMYRQAEANMEATKTSLGDNRPHTPKTPSPLVKPDVFK